MTNPTSPNQTNKRQESLKIVFFTPFFDPFFGGLARNVKTLASLLIKQYDCNVTVVTLDTEKTQKYQEEINKIQVFRLPCINVAKPWGEFYALPKIGPLLKFFRMLSRQQFDVVSTQTRFFVTSWMGFFLGKFKKIPVVHTERGSSFVKEGNFGVRGVAFLVDQTLGRMILSLSDQVVGVSERTAKFARVLGAKNPRTIYNGIKLDFWAQPLDEAQIYSKYGLDGKKFVISFVGRIIAAKGVFDLLESMGRMKNLKLRLIIVGDGPYLPALKRQVQKLALEQQVLFTGALGRRGVREILKISDLFVNPSYTEGLPTSVMEAVASQTYVIATDVGGTREILSDSHLGRLFLPGDTKRLRELVEEAVVQKPTIVEVPKYFVNKFDWNVIAKAYYDLFQQEAEK